MDGSFSSILMLGATVLFVLILIRIITKPIKAILKFLIHAVLGYLLLLLVNFLGAYVGLEIEMSVLNVALACVFGVPGVALLILAKFLF